MRKLFLASFLALGGCGEEDFRDPGNPNPNPNPNTATCANTVGSCGDTVGGVRCTGNNGGQCAAGVCTAGGFCDSGSSASCANTGNSCGSTIAGVFCNARSGGSCSVGICTAQGICDSGGGGCQASNPNSCAGETVCISGRCEAAFPRRYSITITDLILPTRDTNDECWDVGCGAPDPFVEVVLNGTVIGETTTVQDTFTVTYNEVFEANIIAGSDLSLNVYDDDLTAPDFATGCGAEPLTAAHIRDATLACNGSTGNISFIIVPR